MREVATALCYNRLQESIKDRKGKNLPLDCLLKVILEGKDTFRHLRMIPKQPVQGRIWPKAKD
jgi:hypothetical protein